MAGADGQPWSAQIGQKAPSVHANRAGSGDGPPGTTGVARLGFGGWSGREDSNLRLLRPER
ncbi:MAG TPA: hypothetical protein PK752_15615, partial [Accumulibacter sp.]|uniref:hypothetical protein n=1 Tax=Accumulibacter sp. TaxID=2053492 RepID=UPI002BF1A51C